MHDIALGVRRFKQRTYPEKTELFKKLANGQQPPILFITCSDSRIDPHLFTDSNPGDLFVIRNAGNLIPPYRENAAGGEQGTLEYAVAVLGVRDIVVCGHSDCGAMKGLLAPETLAAVPSVAAWLEVAKPTLNRVASRNDGDRVIQTIEANTLQQIDNLRTHPCVRQALDDGRLAIHAWVFDIPSGTVTTYDTARAGFVELADRLTPVEANAEVSVAG